MVNSKHSVKLKSTPRIGLRSSLGNMNDSQDLHQQYQAQMKMKIPLKRNCQKNVDEVSAELIKLEERS